MSTDTAVPRFSIVVPTYQRRDVLVGNLALLADVERPWPIELVVVVDGSRDGSVEAVRELVLPFPTRAVFQENAGAAAARNHGAEVATGEVLLFLDDDMAVDPGILVAHDRALRAGADAVVGHIPLHPDSPRTVLTAGVRRWADRRLVRLQDTSTPLAAADLLTGQLSVRADVFRAAGGFDADFNQGGTFGAEDTDFLYRLVKSGARVRAAADAVSYQRYVVTPSQYLRQWRQGGQADRVLLGKHPELADQLDTQHGGRGLRGRVVKRLAARRTPLGDAAGAWVLRRAEAGRDDLLTQLAFAQARDLAYWAGRLGVPAPTAAPRRLPVLAYHAIDDTDDPVLAPWSVTPAEFAAHVEGLHAEGWTFVGGSDLVAHLEGRELPARSVLLTFDDGYVSFATDAVPVLQRVGAPAVVFLVTELVGQHNQWDTDRGAAALPLLDGPALKQLQEDGWQFGAHSRTHAHLGTLAGEELRREVEGPLADFAALGLEPPTLFAYPYGEHNLLVRSAIRRAGYRGALALEQGATAADRYAYPRVEVRRGMSVTELSALLQGSPQPSPLPQLRREAAALARRVLHRLPLQR